ncbi:hypothetical protein A2U01_0098179, partial [Trifolium medium]|nr:hypothetical protein [Trifolium medium]
MEHVSQQLVGQDLMCMEGSVDAQVVPAVGCVDG